SSADILSDSASSRSSSDHSLPAPSSRMRPSHHLYSLVPSIHRSSAAISVRPSHDSSSTSPSRKRNALRDRGIDARVVVEAVDRDEVETSARDLVEVRVDRVTHPVTVDDICVPAQ
nr:hypothetical protein [Tanacetum cinerariifolium]